MIRPTRFWVSLGVFQVLFGLAVFAVTRDYYVQDSNNVGTHPPIITQPASAWPQGITESDIARLAPSAFGESAMQDPVEISRQANQFFANRQYQRAADSYDRLLTFNPNNVEVLNNLGLTLYYLDRSDEALRRLNEGVAVDPENQRIWLTTGYVNSQLGNVEQARTALTTATQIGTDESIRRSAVEMLEALP
ncbi:MAG: tetratricopeptide repeat protein [Gammaproteobacteria bacterium]|nr:tetratricopeptide repeat protein [Gammaproteobacteria bacterium]